jgi:hypothetical protein
MRKDFTTNEFAEVFIPDIIIHNMILIEYIYAKTIKVHLFIADIYI